MISFAYPWAIALLPLPVLVWFLAAPTRERGAVSVPSSVLAFLEQQSASSSGSRAARPAELAAKAIGWVALICALAGPFVQRPAVLTPSGRDIVVAIDLSASMAETDMQVGDRTMARIDVIRDRLSGFLRGRQGDRVALVGFATEAFLIAPLTFDTVAVSEMLDEVTIGLPGRKTDLGQAIGMAVKLLRGEPDAERLLVLVSDGEANAGEIAAQDAARLADELGLTIFAIGFAAEIDGDNAAHMANLAQLTGGQYRSADSSSALADVYAELDRMIPTTPEANASERRVDLRWITLAVALICLLFVGWQEYRDP